MGGYFIESQRTIQLTSMLFVRLLLAVMYTTVGHAEKKKRVKTGVVVPVLSHFFNLCSNREPGTG